MKIHFKDIQGYCIIEEMKKKILLIIPILLISSGVLLYRPAVSHVMDRCLKDFCRDQLAGEMFNEGIYKENGIWVIDKPQVNTDKRKFIADRIHVSLDINPFFREVELHIHVINPYIQIEKDTAELQAVALEFIPRNFSVWSFSIKSKVTVEKGILAWNDSQKAFFELEAFGDNTGKKGHLLFEIEGSEKGRNKFECQLEGQNEGPIIADLHFEQLDFASFFDAVKSFGIPFNGWEITEGVLDGNVVMTFEMHQRPRIVGKGTLHNFAFQNEELKLQGKVKKALLDAHTDPLKKVVGKLEISEESSLVLLNKDNPYWEIEDILGGIYFQGKDLGIIQIKGNCHHFDTSFGLEIAGDLRYPDESSSLLDLAVSLIADEKVASVHLVTKQLDAVFKSVDVTFGNIGPAEFSFVRSALEKYSPELKNFTMLQGGIDVSGVVYLKGLQPTDIKIENIVANDFIFEALPWDFHLKVRKGTGDFFINLLEEEPLASVKAHFAIDGGEALWGSKIKFADINTTLKIEKGVIQKSLIKGSLAGMKGKLEIDWLSPLECIKIDFSGNGRDIPQFEKYLKDDQVTVVGSLKKNGEVHSAEGVVTIINPVARSIDTLEFGFDIENVTTKLTDLTFKKGTLKAENVSLGKYLTPFLYSQNNMSVQGIGSFIAYIDPLQAVVEYEGKNLLLETPLFSMEVKKIAKSFNPETETLQYASHHFDFQKRTHFGSIPINEGTLYDKRSGLFLTDIDTYVTVEGDNVNFSLKNGTLAWHKENPILRALSLDFAYNYKEGLYALSHISAKILKDSDYYLTGDRIVFNKDSGDFDVWMGDKKQDILRLVGTIKTQTPDLISIDFNHANTHFGKIHPDHFNCILRNWDTVEDFRFQASVDLAELFQELSVLHSAFASFSPPKGIMNLNLSYDQGFKCLAEAHDVEIGEMHFKKGNLDFFGTENQWKISKLDLGDFSLNGEIVINENHITANHMKLRYGQDFSMDLMGNILVEQGAFDGRVTDFKQVSDSGIITGTGSIRANLKKGQPGYELEAVLNTHLKKWNFKGISFKDAKDISCHYISGKDVTFRNLKTAFLDENQSICGYIDLEKAKFSLETDYFEIDRLHFDIPSQNLIGLSRQLKESFPEKVTPKMESVIANLKKTGSLKGTYSLNATSDFATTHLELEPDLYHFLEQDYLVKNFSLSVDPFQFKSEGIYLYKDQPVPFEVLSYSPDLEEGKITLDHLVLEWDNRSFKSAKGEISGAFVDLKRQNWSEDSYEMLGSVHVNKKFPFFSDRLGGDYQLDGMWQVKKGDISFKGELKGEEVLLNGCQFDSLKAKVDYTPKKIQFTGLEIADPAGFVTLKKMDLNKSIDEEWDLFIPEIIVTKFRPGLLKIADFSQQITSNALLVQDLYLKNVQGRLSDPKTLVGKGHFNFTNRPKKNLRNALFDIPAELLANIGLDLSILNPVGGTIFYELDKGKIHLLKFKDMYSERKLSKFYLPDFYASTIDFSGNLDIQFKLKQFNLLFKLAEPYTVSIQGHITKPTYRLLSEK